MSSTLTQGCSRLMVEMVPGQRKTAATEDYSGEGSSYVDDSCEGTVVGGLVSGAVVIRMVAGLDREAGGNVRGNDGQKHSSISGAGLFSANTSALLH
jgi:hypothetical protein